MEPLDELEAWLELDRDLDLCLPQGADEILELTLASVEVKPSKHCRSTPARGDQSHSIGLELIGEGLDWEVEAAAKLEHPNIVTVYEVGGVEERLFFSMRLITGQSLSESMKERRFSYRKALALIEKIARALFQKSHTTRRHLTVRRRATTTFT